MDDDPHAISSPPSSNGWWVPLLPSPQSQHSPSHSAIAELDTLNWPSSDLSAVTNRDAARRPIAMDGSAWSHVLASGFTNEAMQNLAIENLQDMLFSRVLRQGNEALFPEQSRKMDDIMLPWELPLKSFAFPGDIDEDGGFISSTCAVPEMEPWPATIADSSIINPFDSSLQLPRIKHEYSLPSSSHEHHRITLDRQSEHVRMKKQSYSFPTAIAGARAPSPLWLQTSHQISFPSPAIHDEFSGRWPQPQPSRPAAPPVKPLSKQPPQMLSATAYNAAMERKPFYAASLRTTAQEGGEATSDRRRNPATLSSCEGTSEGLLKRPRMEESAPSPHPYKQVRKEKLGDRITALQQLVSPFGKTDTASVLLEAIGYIKFLQEQVQVLSTPYMKAGCTASQEADGVMKNGECEEAKLDLRSRGLCLVPVSCTMHVANENGADFWAPSLGGGYRSSHI